MKTILMSIQPKWCELITGGEKPIEIRKTRPKEETPIKVYIYETKGRYVKFVRGAHTKYGYGRGKVIGEFICDRIEEFMVGSLKCDEIQKLACLSYPEMKDYFYKPEELFGKTAKVGYGWHISELKIYDQPKELGEFYRSLPEKVLEEGDYDCRKDWDVLCADAPEGSEYCAECIYGGRVQITRPPQSYMFVEELEAEL